MIRPWLLWVKKERVVTVLVDGSEEGSTGPVGCKPWYVVDAHILLIKREVITPKIKTLFCEGRNGDSFS